ncbi:MAG: hypothetical protein V4684_04715 [Pseudomonadota bacterium]
MHVTKNLSVNQMNAEKLRWQQLRPQADHLEREILQRILDGESWGSARSRRKFPQCGDVADGERFLMCASPLIASSSDCVGEWTWCGSRRLAKNVLMRKQESPYVCMESMC